ncbi:MAG: hypothetical protein V5A31_06690 [Haloferacaceae archaeon]
MRVARGRSNWTSRRWTACWRGTEAVGAAGRFATVLDDVESVCDDLGLSVETTWRSEREPATAAERLADALFGG